jgi:hypothetical protein
MHLGLHCSSDGDTTHGNWAVGVVEVNEHGHCGTSFGVGTW